MKVDIFTRIMRMTDEQGKLIYTIAYDPWGRTVYESAGDKSIYKNTGQELDAGTGLYYYNARYYDPLLACCWPASSSPIHSCQE